MKLDLQLDPRAVVQPPVSFLMIFIDKGIEFFDASSHEMLLKMQREKS